MLNEYKKKRDFSRTPEPPPDRESGTGPLMFVVQKHDARRLHYDLRLELNGVMKSWAVPNGPSLDPRTKRLAVMVEDHPIEYGSFEGVIPKGEYGAGQVIIWDRGTYSPDEDGKSQPGDRTQAEEILRNGLEKGKISISLQGEKLKGSWALVKMQHTKNDWLLIKHPDEFARPGIDIQKEETSVVSGRTVEDLRENQPPVEPGSGETGEIPGARSSPFPSSLSPMLASLITKPFSDPDWLFEPKLDGYRTIAFIRESKVKLLSRRGLDVTAQYPYLAESLGQQPVKELVLDGEVVALDETGRLCFQCLQNHLESRQIVDSNGKEINPVIIYYVFDILYHDGKDLRATPLYLRKKLLEKVLKASAHIRPVEYFEKDGETLYEVSINHGLEGVIAKLKDSTYETGLRSKNWLKIKATRSDEFIIGGYTRGAGSRLNTFGALLLGNYDDEGKLIFSGHVGSGFDDKSLIDLRQKLDALKSDRSPFEPEPMTNESAVWVRPDLIAEVKFSERTQEGLLRTPVFLRLREDKLPQEVRIAGSDVNSTTGIPEINSLNSSENKTIEKILKLLAGQGEGLDIEVEGYKVYLSNLDKELWPANDNGPAVTKRDLIKYLVKVSPYLLPHLQDRPLTLTRYPDGIFGQHFYQKHWDSPLPGFVKTVPLQEHDSDFREYLVCNNLPTLLWLGQLANIDLHTWFSRIKPEPILPNSEDLGEKTADFFSNYPDFIVFDIDPYIYSGKESRGAEPELNRRAFEKTCESAIWLKGILTSLSLNSFVKTSGKTGLHIHVPIVRRFDFHAVHSLAKTISSHLLQNHPQDITMDWAVAERTGKIFLDYNQNVRGKTLASVYSPRASPQATVSTPLLWNEVGKVYPTDFTIFNVPERLAGTGDIWSEILDKRTDLSKILKER